MADVIAWFEIPATDVDRAARFYGEVLGATFQRMEGAEGAVFFEHASEGVSGEISLGRPSADGVLVYLAARMGVADAVARVEPAGGTVLTPKTSIGPHGWIAVVQDTEGNRVGLHSMDG